MSQFYFTFSKIIDRLRRQYAPHAKIDYFNAFSKLFFLLPRLGDSSCPPPLRRPCSAIITHLKLEFFTFIFQWCNFFARIADQRLCLRFCRAGARRTWNFYYDWVKKIFIDRKGWVPKTPPHTPKGPSCSWIRVPGSSLQCNTFIDCHKILADSATATALYSSALIVSLWVASNFKPQITPTPTNS